MRHRTSRAVAGTLTALTAFVLLGAHPAGAHPLGNFSVNHSHNFQFETNRIVDRAIVDFAEIPTAQAEPDIDSDGDGVLAAPELQAYAVSGCADLVASQTLTVDGVDTALAVTSASYRQPAGQAGLATGRLECRLEATVQLDQNHDISFVDDYAANRVGWHEINAIGVGVQLIESPVPTVSGTDELRSYPVDLLASPLDVRELQLTLAPGVGADDPTPTRVRTSEASNSIFDGGPFAGAVQQVTDRFNDLVGRRDLTLGVGLLAVALAMVLGASHALLPGHGKTVMAAYIAGRQGSSRDAVIVGATVTATHTGGVLILGLALTLSSSLAGETVLGWLGVASGAIIAVLGLGLFWSALRHRAPVHGHHHHIGGRHIGGHTHDHHHDDEPERPHRSIHRSATSPLRQAGQRRVTIRARTPAIDAPSVGHNVSVLTRSATKSEKTGTAVKRRPAPPAGTDSHHHTTVSRRGLIGMGVAGGLVPSPSALIVLLSAIALGRTAFGIVLVVGYGLGMAATLTLAGLLLVRVRDRYANRATDRVGRVASIGRVWSRVSPYATAALVLVVGLGIAIRGGGSL